MAMRTTTRFVVPILLTLALIVAGMPDAFAVSRPSAPRSVHAKPGNTTVRLTWIAPLTDGGSRVNGYLVQRSAAATGPWSTATSLAATTFAWKDTGLVNGTRYYYRLKAHNSAGWGSASPVVSAVPRTVPSAPQSPAATSGDASATVSWTAPASDGGATINSYRLEYSTNGTTWSNLSAGTQTQLAPGGLQNGLEYRFRVRAHNVAGWGSASGEVRTIPGLPLAPTGLTGESTVTGAHFSWAASATVSPALQAYEIEYSKDGILWTVDYNSPNVTTYPMNGTVGATYQFRVRAENSAGYSSWTDPVSVVAGLKPGAVSNPTVTYYGSPLFANSVGWSAPTTGSAVQGYYVDRIVTEGPYVRVATVAATNFPSYYDSGVSHFTDYWYRITPYNQVGSGPSSEVHVTTS